MESREKQTNENNHFSNWMCNVQHGVHQPTVMGETGAKRYTQLFPMMNRDRYSNRESFQKNEWKYIQKETRANLQTKKLSICILSEKQQEEKYNKKVSKKMVWLQ